MEDIFQGMKMVVIFIPNLTSLKKIWQALIMGELKKADKILGLGVLDLPPTTLICPLKKSLDGKYNSQTRYSNIQ